MRHSSFVHIRKSTQYTSTTISCFRFRKGFLFKNPIKQISAQEQFHDEITIRACFKMLVQLRNIGTFAQIFQTANFIIERISTVPNHFGTLDFFDGIFGTRWLVMSNKDFAKGTDTQLRREMIKRVVINSVRIEC